MLSLNDGPVHFWLSSLILGSDVGTTALTAAVA